MYFHIFHDIPMLFLLPVVGDVNVFFFCCVRQDAVRKSTALGLEDLAAAALSQLAKAQMALGQSEARARWC